MALRSDMTHGRDQQQQQLRPSTSSGEARHSVYHGAPLINVSEGGSRPSTSSSIAGTAPAPSAAAATSPAPIAPSIIPPRAPKRTGMPKLQLPSRPSTSSAAINGKPPLGQLTGTSSQQSNARPSLSISPEAIRAASSSGSRQPEHTSQSTNLSIVVPAGPSFGGLSSDADSVYEGTAGNHFPAPGEAGSAAPTGPHHTSIYPDTVPHASGSRDPQALTNDLRRAIGRLSFEEEEDAAAARQASNDLPTVGSVRTKSHSTTTCTGEQTPTGLSHVKVPSSSAPASEVRRKPQSRPTSSRGTGSNNFEDESELILDGNLEILDRLGEGASGEVRKAKYKPTGLVMAMKTINTSPNPDIHRQILRELAFNRTCHSEYIVRYFGAYLDNEDTNIVIGMELCEGGSLDSIYKRVKQRNGRMGEKVLARIAESGLKGLAYLHERKIIHRDIKPSNMLVTRNGDIKLCDFGVSGELIDSLAGTFTGTSFYMAPERIKNLPYNITSDVWSLGLTVLELASNRFPFPAEGDPPLGPIDLLSYVISMKSPELKDDPANNVRWTRAFRDFIEHCLEKDGNKRYGPVKMLNHPWIKKSQARVPPVDVGRFVAEVWGWPVPEKTGSTQQIAAASPAAESAKLAPRTSLSRTTRHGSTIIAEDVEVPGLGRVPSIRQAPKPFGPLSTPTAAQFTPPLPSQASPQPTHSSTASLPPSLSAPRTGTSSASLLTEPRGSVDAQGIDIEGRTLDERAAARRREADVGLIGSPADEFDVRHK